MNNLDNLRKLMTLRRQTGGDNSAQLSTASTQSQRLVAYNKPEGTTSLYASFSASLINTEF